MPILLPNVLITTSRASYSSGTGVTSAESGSNVTAVPAHIDEDKDGTFITQTQGSLDTYYWGYVASGTDIAAGDVLTSITLLDGVTPWPADWASGGAQVWRVTWAQEMPGMLLPERKLRIVRARGSGPSH